MGSFPLERAIQLLHSEQATLADTGHIPSPCVNVLPQWKGAQSSQARSSSLRQRSPNQHGLPGAFVDGVAVVVVVAQEVTFLEEGWKNQCTTCPFSFKNVRKLLLM